MGVVRVSGGESGVVRVGVVRVRGVRVRVVRVRRGESGGSDSHGW